jgi:hypothetical protein
MSKVARDLNALAKALRGGLVTRGEAAERIRALAARMPTFIVLIRAGDSQRRLLGYVVSSGDEKGAKAAAKRALGLGEASERQVEVVAARLGVVRTSDGAMES